MVINLQLPLLIGDGRVDSFLNILSISRRNRLSDNNIILDWKKVTGISPAGFAILACIFDSFIEQKNIVKSINLPKKFKKIPVVNNLNHINRYRELPKPQIHNFENRDTILRGNLQHLDIIFMEYIESKFNDTLNEDLYFACKLIINELMQNSVDHSNAERYYMYGGRWKNEFHIGVLDMGSSIPAKLEQKYVCGNDLEYLELAMKSGISTRRQRPGGFGLHYFTDFLKEHDGKLTIISRKAQIRRYFRTRRSQKNILKHYLPGTWCFARFPLER